MRINNYSMHLQFGATDIAVRGLMVSPKSAKIVGYNIIPILHVLGI